jgi:biotin transport system substrate-specific component
MSIKSTISNHSLSQFWISVVPLSWLQKICLMFVGTTLLALSAKISIPFWPVNTTMQSFTVIALGSIYGRQLGVATILLYLFEGAIGLPVFTGTPECGLGLVYMVGPSGGFLLGFIVSAYLSGTLVERGWGKNLGSALVVFAIGEGALFIPGVLWLTYLMGLDVTSKNFIAWVPALLVKEFLGAAGLSVVSPLLRRSIKV